MVNFFLRNTQQEDREWIGRWLVFQWGAEIVISHDVVFHPSDLPGFIAIDQISNEPIGLITYHLTDDECEIVTLDSLREGFGIGNSLIEAVKERARSIGCKRLWLITTNDNLNALRFYQKRGFRVIRVIRGAADKSRETKPEIPEVGYHGIPIHDEFELEFTL
jgi:DNA-3-methyladenine glycosylase I